MFPKLGSQLHLSRVYSSRGGGTINTESASEDRGPLESTIRYRYPDTGEPIESQQKVIVDHRKFAWSSSNVISLTHS